ncbi:MAG TPA: trypsin-like peptidase domain-containing protein [Chloroflexia bacterium]|nr:trypsin-like peptidase domain-containing protein [Chloroflexia bacterium]
MEIKDVTASRVRAMRQEVPVRRLLLASILSLTLVACGSEATTTRSLSATDVSTTVATTTSAAATTAAVAPTTASDTVAASTTQAASSASQSEQVAQAVSPAATSASANQSDQAESNSVVGVVKRLNPAVVTVYNKSKYTPGRLPGGVRVTPGADSNTGSGFVVQGIGSGVIISSDGYIVTNAHVVDGQDNLSVALNDGKSSVPAKLIGVDKLGDLAVLKIDSQVPAYAKWASHVDVGETVIAIGAALGDFRNSVSKGVVSGLNRTLPDDTGTNVYIQTDTPINHGNSGGPLLNLQGEIVGINTAVVRSTGGSTRGSTDVAEGLGFAIPYNIAQQLTGQLISKGSVTRPYFGITYQMISPAEAGTLSYNGKPFPSVEGAWIGQTSSGQSGIVKGGPADKAGLKDNDVITAINGEALNDNNPLVNVILKYKPGDTIKLTVQRGDQTLTLSLTLAERPSNL